MPFIAACNLGRVAYAPAWELQRKIQARLIEAKKQNPQHDIPHVLLLVEHPPVYTLGKNGDEKNLLLSEEALAARGATFYRIDRGGDITYHGPGQLVGYPILDLDQFFTDIHRYLRELEETIILTCAEYGLKAGRFKGRTGVWIGPDDRGFERKICAMGIRSSRWVTMHGFAFNLNTNLDYFHYINPCGITDRGVTSLARELEKTVDEEEVREYLVQHFAARFGADIQLLDQQSSRKFLEEYLAADDLMLALTPEDTSRAGFTEV